MTFRRLVHRVGKEKPDISDVKTSKWVYTHTYTHSPLLLYLLKVNAFYSLNIVRDVILLGLTYITAYQNLFGSPNQQQLVQFYPLS